MLDALRVEIEGTIDRYCDEPPLRDAVRGDLRRPGFALHPDAHCRAGGLTLGVYSAIRGEATEAAWQAAAAVELYIEASFLFDDVADGDVDEGHGSSVSEEVTLAVAMMNCSVAAAAEAANLAARGHSNHSPLGDLALNCLSACAGQLLDARMERQHHVTSEDALNMTALKAGGCGRLAACVGASIATDDEDLIGLFGEFGRNVTIYLQLLDDLRDASPAEGGSRDMLRWKKTVPLVYFYNSVGAERGYRDDGIMPAYFGVASGQSRAPAFGDSGAGVFGALVAEAYLNEARSALAKLVIRLGPLEHLERYIDAIEFAPQKLLRRRNKPKSASHYFPLARIGALTVLLSYLAIAVAASMAPSRPYSLGLRIGLCGEVSCVTRVMPASRAWYEGARPGMRATWVDGLSGVAL